MGATLDYASTTASSWKEARDKVVDYCTAYYGQDPYNGTLSTIDDWSECKKSFDSVDDFEEYASCRSQYPQSRSARQRLTISQAATANF